ncbi:hypothetical protein [Streptomyces sp. NPDC016626]|uniref:hypothetical protein n=1 Tax=Streptomyces sp. NPDC016626 TaxID=3364968 RepID=UPI0036FBDC50
MTAATTPRPAPDGERADLVAALAAALTVSTPRAHRTAPARTPTPTPERIR